jgi:hypothetical protein
VSGGGESHCVGSHHIVGQLRQHPVSKRSWYSEYCYWGLSPRASYGSKGGDGRSQTGLVSSATPGFCQSIRFWKQAETLPVASVTATAARDFLTLTRHISNDLDIIGTSCYPIFHEADSCLRDVNQACFGNSRESG